MRVPAGLHTLVKDLRSQQSTTQKKHVLEMERLHAKIRLLERERMTLQVQSTAAEGERLSWSNERACLGEENRRLSAATETLTLQNVRIPFLDSRVRDLQEDHRVLREQQATVVTELIQTRTVGVTLERENAKLYVQVLRMEENEQVRVATQDANMHLSTSTLGTLMQTKSSPKCVAAATSPPPSMSI
jgi:hypothetical protein